MPPGTGDIALSLSQSVPVAGAVLVTTPQTVSLADTRRAVMMYRKLNIPTIGLIENMSYFVCPDCGTRERHLRQRRRRAARERYVRAVPRQRFRSTSRFGVAAIPACRSCVGAPDAAPSRALFALAERVAQQVSISVLCPPGDSADAGELSKAERPTQPLSFLAF